MEANISSEIWLHNHAKAIDKRKPDPMPEISQLMLNLD
tara:strand:+ start:173 stop:286 length:114 start_codon:yes stop_codon:yes gene_type:complete